MENSENFYSISRVTCVGKSYKLEADLQGFG